MRVWCPYTEQLCLTEASHSNWSVSTAQPTWDSNEFHSASFILALHPPLYLEIMLDRTHSSVTEPGTVRHHEPYNTAASVRTQDAAYRYDDMVINAVGVIFTNFHSNNISSVVYRQIVGLIKLHICAITDNINVNILTFCQLSVMLTRTYLGPKALVPIQTKAKDSICQGQWQKRKPKLTMITKFIYTVNTW